MNFPVLRNCAFRLNETGCINICYYQCLQKSTLLPSPDMGRCVITRGRQALELRSNLSERRSLTDPIQQTSDQCSSSYSLRNLQWAIAHGIFFYDTILDHTFLLSRIFKSFEFPCSSPREPFPAV